MAKHTYPLKHEMQYPLDKGAQEYMGKLHDVACKPAHTAGRYSPAEVSMQIAMSAGRQSDFYQKNDRTEDARGE